VSADPRAGLPLVHVVGRRNHGKTTLLVEVIAELRGRGVAVGSIKHSGHAHELDQPGKDTFRHRAAGAAPSAIVTPTLLGCFAPRMADEDCYARLAPLFGGCALVLVEGHIDGPGPHVEVFRAAVGSEPLARARREIVAVITDDPLHIDRPLWPRSDVPRLADALLALSGGPPR
jgi:molybdopterin-guanine dinucleotide biosynthesis protein B